MQVHARAESTMQVGGGSALDKSHKKKDSAFGHSTMGQTRFKKKKGSMF